MRRAGLNRNIFSKRSMREYSVQAQGKVLASSMREQFQAVTPKDGRAWNRRGNRRVLVGMSCGDDLMKVAEEGIIRFERRPDQLAGMQMGISSGLVYAGQDAGSRDQVHDARGLLIAVGLCACCWLGLGYFLLT